jgi:hypothetical protein
MQWAERIGRRLKLRDLHVLFAAVEAGSMAKAKAIVTFCRLRHFTYPHMPSLTACRPS